MCHCRRKFDGGKTEESCRRNCIRAAVKEELKGEMQISLHFVRL
jgi:hypothetical protein